MVPQKMVRGTPPRKRRGPHAIVYTEDSAQRVRCYQRRHKNLIKKAKELAVITGATVALAISAENGTMEVYTTNDIESDTGGMDSSRVVSRREHELSLHVPYRRISKWHGAGKGPVPRRAPRLTLAEISPTSHESEASSQSPASPQRPPPKPRRKKKSRSVPSPPPKRVLLKQKPVKKRRHSRQTVAAMTEEELDPVLLYQRNPFL